MPAADFASVKLPVSLVSQAREAAQPMRRSVASQIEYWATLGRVVEHTGLTAQEARTAIENYELAARETHTRSLVDDLEVRFVAAGNSGGLAGRVREVVAANKAKAVKQKKAA